MDVQLDKLNILVVEDNPKTRKLIEADMLLGRMREVVVARAEADGRDARRREVPAVGRETP